MQKYIILVLITFAACETTKTFKCHDFEREDDRDQRNNKHNGGNNRNNRCPEQFDPVCATQKNRNQMNHKTYSNSCKACQDNNTIYYAKGECDNYHHKAKFCDPDDRFDHCDRFDNKVCGFQNDSKTCRKGNCKQYHNKCQACRDNDVWYYVEGSCDQLRRNN